MLFHHVGFAFVFFLDTDYATGIFPSAAHVLDILRCSVSFDNIKDMVAAMKQFENALKKQDSNVSDTENRSCGCIVDVVRIKNGFNDILSWQSVRDGQYCDVKFNVIIYNSDTNESQIGEVQFLLKFLLKVSCKTV